MRATLHNSCPGTFIYKTLFNLNVWITVRAAEIWLIEIFQSATKGCTH